MTRVKGGYVTKRKHKKVLESAKGYWMSRHKQFKKAKEATLHAGEYAFAGRKLKKRQFKTLWIIRLNAAVRNMDLKYNKFIHLLKIKKISLDRKILAKIVVEHPKIFQNIVEKIRQ